MNKKKKILIAAGIALAFLLLLKIFSKDKKAPRLTEESIASPVKKGTLTMTVSGYGDIRALKNYKVILKTKKFSTLTFIVPEGERVKKGEVVARLNTEDVESRLEDYEMKIADTQLALASSESDLKIQITENKFNLKTAEQDLEAAKLNMEKFTDADLPGNLRNAKLDLKTAESDLVRRQRRYKDLQELLERGFVTEDEVEEGRISLEAAEVARETAQVDQHVMKMYVIPEAETERKNKVEKARINLEKTMANNKTRLATQKMKVEQNTHKLEKLKREYKEWKEDLEKHVLIAPVDGIVMYGDPRRRRSYEDLQIGQNIHSGSVLMTIPDFSGMKAVINITEADIDKVKKGQSVNLKVDAVQQKIYAGHVSKVAEVANNQGWWSSGVKEFEVEVAIEDDEHLRPGFSCEVEIMCMEIPNALYVPVQAVFKDNQNFIVYRSSRRKYKRQTIKIGKSTISQVQILDGLQEGDKVLLYDPEEI